MIPSEPAAAAEAAGAPGRPWEPPPPTPKPEGVEYGFLNAARGELVGTSRERLVHLCRTAPPLRVWTPETANLVPPWEVPYLLDALRDRLEDEARRSTKRSGVIALVLAGVSLLVDWVVLILLAPLLAGWLLYVRRGEKQVRSVTAEDFRRQEANAHYARWEEAQPAHQTAALGAAIAAVGVAQVLGLNESVAAAGMRAERVLDGETWRLLTAALLHGSAIHFFMNFSALFSLGRTMEARAPRAYVPLVFLAAALAGNVASLYLPPHGVSVGASGGLMGMMGFLLVLAYRRAAHLPEGFRRLVMQNLMLMGLIGVVGYQFIDNAAHAGGLVAGVAVGGAAIPPGDRVPEWTGGAGLRRAGLGALVFLCLASAATAVLVLARVLG